MGCNDAEKQLNLLAEVARLRQERVQLVDVCRRFIWAMPWNDKGTVNVADLYSAYNRALAVLASLSLDDTPWGEPINAQNETDSLS